MSGFCYVPDLSHCSVYHTNRRQESGRSGNEAITSMKSASVLTTSQVSCLMFVYWGARYGEFRPSVQDVTVNSVLPPKLNRLPVFSVSVDKLSLLVVTNCCWLLKDSGWLFIHLPVHSCVCMCWSCLHMGWQRRTCLEWGMWILLLRSPVVFLSFSFLMLQFLVLPVYFSILITN